MLQLYRKKSNASSIFYLFKIKNGRSERIRTSGPLNPIQVLYQTEPHPDLLIYYKASSFISQYKWENYFIDFCGVKIRQNNQLIVDMINTRNEVIYHEH